MIIDFSKKSKTPRKRVLADVQIVEVEKGSYAYSIKGRVKNSSLLNEALLYASEHILKEMLVLNNNPEEVLDICEDLAQAALEEILGVGDE